MKTILILICFAAVVLGQPAGPIFPPPTKPACTASRTTNCSVHADSSGNVSVGTTSLDPSGGITAPNFDKFNPSYLRSWQAALAKVQEDSGQAVLCYIGDSWTAGKTITEPLRYHFATHFGKAGPGYAPAYSASAGPTGITVSTAGTWTTKDKSSATVEGVNLYSTNSVDVATPATKTFSAGVSTLVTGYVIHWIGQAGGGSFTWAVDGGAATTIDTSAASGYRTTAISGLSSTNHSLVLTVTVAGDAGVTLLGVDVQHSDYGVRTQVIGQSGATAGEYAAVDGTRWTAGMAALGCNVAVIQLGINDAAASRTSAAFIADIATIVGRLRTATPTVDILLVAPPDNGGGYAALLTTYETALENLARTSGYSFVALGRSFGPFATANANGLFLGNQHPNAAGGRAIAGIIQAMLSLPGRTLPVKAPNMLQVEKIDSSSPAILLTGMGKDASVGSSSGVGLYLVRNSSNRQFAIADMTNGASLRFNATAISGYNTATGAAAAMTVGQAAQLTTIRGTVVLSDSISTPASATANCTAGTIVFDTSFVYFCVATNTWLRAAIVTWP